MLPVNVNLLVVFCSLRVSSLRLVSLAECLGLIAHSLYYAKGESFYTQAVAPRCKGCSASAGMVTFSLLFNPLMGCVKYIDLHTQGHPCISCIGPN